MINRPFHFSSDARLTQLSGERTTISACASYPAAQCCDGVLEGLGMRKWLVLAASGIALAGCETNSGPYVRIGPGPELAYAEAQCNILAMNTGRGVIAWGSPNYVAGAQIGNAIGNAIRAEEFKKNCMVMEGWARGPSVEQQRAAARRTTARKVTAPPPTTEVQIPYPPNS
jgi:hypothetical protein